MFDKQKFSDILQSIAKNYNSISEFADESTVGRSYISKYIHEKIASPPSPKVLKKIAEYSKGVTTYEELMIVCGYQKMQEEYELLINGDLKYVDLLFEEDNLTNDVKIKAIDKLIFGLEGYIDSCLEIIDNMTKIGLELKKSQRYNKEIIRTRKEIKGLRDIKKKLEEQKQ